MNSLFLEALARRPVARPPVWLMRQAGRYLPSYQALRRRYSLIEMFTHPALIEEATLLPMEEIGPDAAIVFSDITLIALSLGLALSFEEGKGPIIRPRISTEQDVADLEGRYEPLSFLGEAIASLQRQLCLPLIGFCGAPFTLACYFAGKKSLYRNPAMFYRLVQLLTRCTKAHLGEQIAAGVDAVQIFDSSAYLLPHHLWRRYSLPFLSELVAFLKQREMPSIVFARGACLFQEDLISLAPSCISFDWHTSFASLRESVPPHIAIQGNFDPDLLYASPQKIREEIGKHLPLKPGVIVNLGHGLKPDKDPENVRNFERAIKDYG